MKTAVKIMWGIGLVALSVSPALALTLSNPSFEQGEGGKPSEWQPWGNATFQWDATTARTGSRSLMIQKSEWTVGWKGPEFSLSNSKKDTYTWFTFRGWIRTDQSTESSRLSISWYDGEGNFLTNSDSDRMPFHTKGSSEEWVELELHALPPQNAIKGVLFLRSDANVGTAWFDDVSLTEREIPAKPPSIVKDAEISKDHNPNTGPYRAFLRDYPDHELSEAARLMIVEQLRFHGKTDEAVQEMEALLAPEENGQRRKVTGTNQKKTRKALGWIYTGLWPF